MRKYDYVNSAKMLIDIEVLNLVSTIHEYKGKQELYLTTQPQILKKLQAISTIQSTDASNRIEGIYTSDKRLKEIVVKKSEPRNRNESEIAGYRDVLTIIHEDYSYVRLNKNDILTLHNRLYTYFPNRFKGQYKQLDNLITEENANGESLIRFQPVLAYMTDSHMNELYKAIHEVALKSSIDPLLYIPCFILDFLCVHPFTDGNGRMSRLLTLLLLNKSGYIVGKYISLEMIIEKSKQSYYESLQDSSLGWHDNQNDYMPFIKYLLGIILKAYEDFDERYNMVFNQSISSEERVYQIIQKSLVPLSKADIVMLCPEISQKTVERVLNHLKNEMRIQMINAGQNTMYLRNNSE